MLSIALFTVGIFPALSLALTNAHCIESPHPPDPHQLLNGAFHGLHNLHGEWGDRIITFTHNVVHIPDTYNVPMYITRDGITYYPDHDVHGVIKLYFPNPNTTFEQTYWRGIGTAALKIFHTCLFGSSSTNAGWVEVEDHPDLAVALVDPHAAMPNPLANSTARSLTSDRGTL